MQHLRWLKHGRQYSHSDEGKPNTFTLTTKIGEHNVDVNGDGSEFAPYVVEADRIRHADCECSFLSDGQAFKRLAKTIISRSRIYIQRLVSGSWTDVPHGLPTKNVLHDYPKDGRCTAYLDFPNIQGYASGARFQVGVEAGRNVKQTFGFRLRSPVNGTFRLEWVIEVPDDVDLAWITTPTSRTDPTPRRIGGRIGDVQIIWSANEIDKRSVTVEPDGSGGKIVRVILGPYDLTAMEWLTVYPDTIAPTINANADDGCESGGDWYVSGFAGDNYVDDGTHVGLSFVIPSSLAASVTVNSMYARMYTGTSNGGTAVFKSLVEDSDPATGAQWGAAHLPSGGSWIRANANQSQAFLNTTWYLGSGDTHPIDLGADLTDLLSSYGDIAAGNRINLAYLWQSGGYAGFEDYNSAGTNEAELLITYTAGGGTTLPPTTLPLTTLAPTTLVPTTLPPTTLAPTTALPTTIAPTTINPTTGAPTTLPPTTLPPTTIAPTTVTPTTLAPTTISPTTAEPTTIPPTTPIVTTLAPTTLGVTTLAPTTSAPTTISPTTPVPTTLPSTTLAPTTTGPTTLPPTTVSSTTSVPTTISPTTLIVTTLPPTTLPPTTLIPTTLAPTTVAVTTLAPTTFLSTTLPPTTLIPTTLVPTTLGPTTEPPVVVVRRRGIKDFGFSFRDRWR